ncbi:MAG: substrate-binding domain-containing protein [Fervidicoccaceae archaeon]
MYKLSFRIVYVFLAAFATIAILSIFTYHILFPQQTRLLVSTTTSLYATGLLDYLGSAFESSHPWISVEFIPVGSGAALELARRGESCAVLVHAPSLEKKYLSTSSIYYHHIFAYNFFVIVGPKNDPANVSTAHNASEAFTRIFLAGERDEAVFISRGDNSGTNVKELQIWNETGLNPMGKKWYKVIGGGMDQALIMANELKAYTLSDIGTYLVFEKSGSIPNLTILFYNSTELINVYSSYLVSGCRGSEAEAAKEFVDFVDESQELIGNFGVSDYGSPLFFPAYGKEEFLNNVWNMLAGDG